MRLSFAQERFEQYLKDEDLTLRQFCLNQCIPYESMRLFRKSGKCNVEIQKKLMHLLYLENDFII